MNLEIYLSILDSENHLKQRKQKEENGEKYTRKIDRNYVNVKKHTEKANTVGDGAKIANITNLTYTGEIAISFELQGK